MNLHVAVEPGPHVRYEFEGEKLPRAARRDIAAMYRPEAVGKSASLESVTGETVQVSARPRLSRSGRSRPGSRPTTTARSCS